MKHPSCGGAATAELAGTAGRSCLQTTSQLVHLIADENDIHTELMNYGLGFSQIGMFLILPS